MSWILSLLSAAFGWVVDLADAAMKWIGYYFAVRLGREKQRKADAEWALEKKDEQQRIASKPIIHRDSLLKRMRSRKQSK